MSDKKSITGRERESAGSQVRSIVLYLAVAMIASGFVMSLIRSVALDITKFSYAYSRILAENRSKSSTDKSDSTFDGSFLRKRLSETISGLKEFGSSLYAKRDNNLDTIVVKNNVAQGPSPTTASPAPFEESALATPEANINTNTSSNSAALKPSEIGVSSSARLPIRNTLSSPTATSSAFVQKVPNPTQTISPISGQELSGTKKPESIQVIFVDPVIRVCSYQPKKYQAKGRVDMPTGKIASLKITWQVASAESKQSLLNVVDFGLVKSGDPFNTEIPWPGIKPQDKKVQVSLTAQLYDRKTAQALLTKPVESSYLWESSSSCPPPKEAKPAITHQLSITNVSKDKSAPDTYVISYRGFIKNTGNVAIDDLKSTQLVRNTEATFVSAQKTEGLSTFSQNKATFTPEPLQQGQTWGYVTVARVVAKDLGIICSELVSEALFGEKSITAPKSRSCFDLTSKYNEE